MLPTLSALSPGQSARVAGLSPDCPLGRRFRDLGLIEGTEVQCLMKSPLGDPSAYLIRGAVIALRRSDADAVTVDDVCEASPAAAAPEKAVRHGAV